MAAVTQDEKAQELLRDILVWKYESAASGPELEEQVLSVTISQDDLVALRRKMGVPASVVVPGYAGKVFGVHVYVG